MNQRSQFVRQALIRLVILLAIAICCPFAAVANDSPAPALTWIQGQPANSPTTRDVAAMTYDPVSKNVVLFGGYNGAYLNDTWTFNGKTWTQLSPTNAPPVRDAAGLAYDYASRKLVLFGGYNGRQYLNDTWLWDGATSTWTPANPQTVPTAVTGPGVFTDPLNGHADMFGGFDGHFYQLKTWQWSGNNWVQLQPSNSPSARGSAAIGLDIKRRVVVLFGGLGDVNPNNTWTWNGKNWTQQSPSVQPPLRFYTGAAYDPQLQEVVVFGGGSGNGPLNDTWAWSGTDWQQVFPAKSPSARESYGMTTDFAINHVVIFGGDDGINFLSDSWGLIGK